MESLRYRGIPIAQLAEHSTFIETALLLIYGELPTRQHYARFRNLLAEHEMIHEGMRNSFLGFPPSGDPMAILSSMINTLSCYYSDAAATADDAGFENAAACLVSKIRTVAAYAYNTFRRTAFDVSDSESELLPQFPSFNVFLAVAAL